MICFISVVDKVSKHTGTSSNKDTEEHGQCLIKHIFTSTIGTLYLCRKGDHFDGIAPQIPVPGRIISGSTITAPCIPVAKEQVSPVMKIPVIWHSRQRQAPIKVHHNHHQLAKLN